MRNIEIKKSDLALFKSLGKTEEEISKALGITTKEVKEAMITFGLIKTKKKEEKDYQIKLIDDISEKLSIFNAKEETSSSTIVNEE